MGRIIPYIMTNKNMFQTTNQIMNEDVRFPNFVSIYVCFFVFFSPTACGQEKISSPNQCPQIALQKGPSKSGETDHNQLIIRIVQENCSVTIIICIYK
jgi:hypothetical protein